MNQIEVVNILITEAFKMNWKVLAVRPLSHPDDYYLMYAVVQNGKGEYVSYLFNITFPAFNNGHYFDNIKDAVDHMNNR